MKKKYIILPLLCVCTMMAAQDNIEQHHQHGEDSTDVFFRHLKLNELVVTGVTGDTKLKNATAPISIVRPQELRSTASTNVIDAIAHLPGIAQLTTGGAISKPIIRGLGYNRVVVMSEGVRQEGQQWGDEHGVEVDGGAVNSVEILKGPASLMYGSDAMAGVVILHSQPAPAEGTMRANVSTEYQTNNGLFGYSLSMAGNEQGFVWDGRYPENRRSAVSVPCLVDRERNTVSSIFNSFGRLPGEPVFAYLLVTDYQGHTFQIIYDITDIIEDPSNPIIEIDDPITIPDTEGGFTQEVDDWDVEIVPIPL